MANDPAFLFYPGDYLRDTQCLSESSQVAYDRIMCEHMRNICISQSQLDFFTKRLNSDQKSELMMVLKPSGSGFCIPWVVDSITKRREYSESRRKNRTSDKEKKKKDMSIISKSYVQHMDNEIEIENIVLVNKESIQKSIFSDQQFIEGLTVTHKGKDIRQAFDECYIHHSNSQNPPKELWEWRQKLNSWLTIKPQEKKTKDGVDHILL